MRIATLQERSFSPVKGDETRIKPGRSELSSVQTLSSIFVMHPESSVSRDCEIIRREVAAFVAASIKLR